MELIGLPDAPRPEQGDWKIKRDKERTVLEIRLLSQLSKQDMASLTAKGRRLLKFAAAPDGEVRFLPS